MVVEQDLKCSNGFEMLKWRWMLTDKGDLLLKDFELTIKTDDFCLKSESDKVEVYACQTNIDKLGHAVSGIVQEKCQINTCIRKCEQNDDMQINVSFYELLMNVDAIDDVRQLLDQTEGERLIALIYVFLLTFVLFLFFK